MSVPLSATSTVFSNKEFLFLIASTLLLHTGDYRYCLGKLWVLRTTVLMDRGLFFVGQIT